MNNSMVAHLWANEKQESANGSNFYFEGESIYSYGRHFEVGRIVRNKRGEKAYLINDTYYSSTTSKHQYYVREAIPTGSKVFYVECNISYCIGNMLFVTNMLECIKDAIEKYKKARTELSYRDVWGNFKNLMDFKEEKPSEGEEVLAYHPSWIDEDFNPRGIRIGFWNGGDDFKSAHWWDYQDCYITISHCDCDDNSLFSDRIKNSIEPELWISLDVITNYLPDIKQNHLSQ